MSGMRAPFLLVVLALMSLPETSWACRCMQRNLAEYFADAEDVVMARLIGSSERDDRRLFEFELLAPPYKGARAATGSTVTYATALSTATCGLPPDIDAVYVAFAHNVADDDGMPWIDSCGGTRVHLSQQLEEPQGFEDVPARFVASQLNALAGLEVLGKVAANAPDPGNPLNEQLIGLLDLAALAHGGTVEVVAAPDLSLVPVARIVDYADVEAREYAYEQPGAVVYARTPGWFRLRLADGRFVWAADDNIGTFFDYAELPIGRLAYLNANWGGFAWPDIGAGLPLRDLRVPAQGRAEFHAEVLESASLGGLPWFRVRVMDGEFCTSTEPREKFSGWVPAYGPNGGETVWFYSRGC